jgi:hypothetical protein
MSMSLLAVTRGSIHASATGNCGWLLHSVRVVLTYLALLLAKAEGRQVTPGAETPLLDCSVVVVVPVSWLCLNLLRLSWFILVARGSYAHAGCNAFKEKWG